MSIFTLLTSYCAVHRKDSLCVLVGRFCISRKGGTGGCGCLVMLKVNLGAVLKSELGQKWRYGALKAGIG